LRKASPEVKAIAFRIVHDLAARRGELKGRFLETACQKIKNEVGYVASKSWVSTMLTRDTVPGKPGLLPLLTDVGADVLKATVVACRESAVPLTKPEFASLVNNLVFAMYKLALAKGDNAECERIMSHPALRRDGRRIVGVGDNTLGKIMDRLDLRLKRPRIKSSEAAQARSDEFTLTKW